MVVVVVDVVVIVLIVVMFAVVVAFTSLLLILSLLLLLFLGIWKLLTYSIRDVISKRKIDLYYRMLVSDIFRLIV